MSTVHLCDQLEAVLHKLQPADRKFATDLIASTRQHGDTDKRLHWLAELLQRAQQPHQAPAKVEVAIGSFKGVYALFAAAAGKLKRPKIRLQLADGGQLVLYKASTQSAEPGVINVTDGRPYPDNKWYGRVRENGTWLRTNKPLPELGEVEALLKKLGEHPAETASEYGRLTGRCCFCDRKLEDEKSTAVGFGPVCADNFGLGLQWKHAVPLFTALTTIE